MFYDLMLDKKEISKTMIYRRLAALEPGEYNMNELSQLFPFSYSKILAAVGEIESVLMELGYPATLFVGNKVFFSESLPTETIFSAYLIQKDIPFLFLLDLITEEPIDFPAFANKNYTSQSTVRRKLVPLRQFLMDYHIHLSVSTMKLIGDERNIRTVLATLLWMSSRGKSFPIQCFEQEKVKKYTKMMTSLMPKNNPAASITALQDIDAAIAYFRIRNGHFVRDDQLYDVFHDEVKQEVKAWRQVFDLPAGQLEIETRYIAFRHYFGAVFFEKHHFLSEKLAVKIRETAPEEDLAIQKFKAFIKKEVLDFSKLSSMRKEHFSILWENLTSVFFTYQVYRSNVLFPFFLMEPEDLPNNLIYTDLFQKLSGFMNGLSRERQNDWIAHCKNDMCRIFAALLLPEYEMSAEKYKLNIAIVQEERYVYIHKLEGFLQSLSYINYQPFEEDKADSYDVIITATKIDQQTVPSAKIIFFTYTMDESEYLNLEMSLKKLYIWKNSA